MVQSKFTVENITENIITEMEKRLGNVHSEWLYWSKLRVERYDFQQLQALVDT